MIEPVLIDRLELDFDELKFEAQYLTNGFQAGQFDVLALFDVSNRIGVRNAGLFGDGIPSEPTRFVSGSDVAGMPEVTVLAGV